MLYYRKEFDFVLLSCLNHKRFSFTLPRTLRCGEGRVVTTDGKGCTDKDECLENPCRNGGYCINQDPRTKYRCVCLDNFWGENCELVQEGRTLKLGMGALAAILVCLLMILSKQQTLFGLLSFRLFAWILFDFILRSIYYFIFSRFYFLHLIEIIAMLDYIAV